MNRDDYNKNQPDLFCQYCKKQCKNFNSLRQHEIRCSKNPSHINVVPTFGYSGKIGWSRGLTKDTDDRLKNVSIGVNKYYESHSGVFTGKSHSEKTKQLMSETARINNFQSHWGVRKSYHYKDVVFQSSYEVEVAKSLDKNNIKWVKPCYGTFKYKDLNNKTHTYTPDFYLPDYDIYLDPKNDYLIENNNPTLGYCDCDKIHWVEEQNNVKIIILDKHHLEWSNIQPLLNDAVGE